MLVNRNLVHQGQLPGFPQNVAPMFLAPQYVGPAAWDLVPQYTPTLVQSAPQQEGMSLGTFLAGVVTVVGGAIMFDPKASEEPKAIAKMALSAAVPFLLNKAFDLEAWPGQWN